MTKFLSLTVVLFVSLQSFAQTEHPELFEYGENGLNDYVVTQVEGKTAEEIYTQGLNYIKETFNNPDEAIQMTIENKKIRVSGVTNELLAVRGIGFSLTYKIEIAIKDGRYKFDLVSLNETEQNTDYKGLPNFDDSDDKRMARNFGKSGERIEAFFNTLNLGMAEYILGGTQEDSDW